MISATGAALGAVGVLAALGAVWALARRTGPWPAERLALRGLAAAACALVVTGVRVEVPAARGRVVLVDASRSVQRAREELLVAARAAWADLDPERDRVALVLFGADVAVAPPVPAGRAGEALERLLATPPDPRGSDLGLALRAALEQAPPGADAVLLSDGRDTGGRALDAAADLAARLMTLHAWVPGAPPPRGARLAALEAPARARPGAPVPVVVEVRAGRPTAVRVSLEADEQVVATGAGDVAPGAPLRLALVAPAPPPGGALRLRARVEAAGPDDVPEDDALEALVLAAGARRAVVVEGVPGAGEPLARALAALGAVERVDPAGATAALAAPADLLAVVDVPADALDPLAPALEAAVDAGAALVLAGARRAFGPGGWSGRPSEGLGPVTVGPGEERERPLAVVVTLDASGSMKRASGASSRYADAVRALAPALGVPPTPLRPGDLLGVVAFAGTPSVVRDLRALAGPGEGAALQARLASQDPGGETDIGPALVRGLELLEAVPPGAERLLVLASDAGDLAPADRSLPRLRALAAATGGERLSILAVLVGVDEAQAQSVRALLEPFGERARLVPVPDAGDSLREAVEGTLLRLDHALREGAFAVRVEAAGRGRGLALPEVVRAYAPTRAREGAEVLARAADPEVAEAPLAVLGRRGLGRVLALPVEAQVAAAALASLGERLLPASREDVLVEARREGPVLALEVQGADLPLELAARVTAADGPSTVVPLVAETPTLARGRARAPSARALEVAVVAGDGQALGRASVADAAHDEAAGEGPDHALLSALTGATGGQVLASLPPPPPRGAAPAEWPVGPAAGLAALAALLLDAALGTWRARRSPRA